MEVKIRKLQFAMQLLEEIDCSVFIVLSKDIFNNIEQLDAFKSGIFISSGEADSTIETYDKVVIKKGCSICNQDFKKIEKDGVFILVDAEVILPAGISLDLEVTKGLVYVMQNDIAYITHINNLELAKSTNSTQNGQ